MTACATLRAGRAQVVVVEAEVLEPRELRNLMSEVREGSQNQGKSIIKMLQ
jgi:hypothetical protein